jgi:hypothetical protein
MYHGELPNRLLLLNHWLIKGTTKICLFSRNNTQAPHAHFGEPTPYTSSNSGSCDKTSTEISENSTLGEVLVDIK